MPDRSSSSQQQLMSAAMINAHDFKTNKRQSPEDYYNQYAVSSQNTFNVVHCNSRLVVGGEEGEARRNSPIAYGEHADDGNACGKVQSRARYIKIRNDEDNYYNDNNNNCNDSGSSSNIRIGKVKQEKKRT